MRFQRVALFLLAFAALAAAAQQATLPAARLIPLPVLAEQQLQELVSDISLQLEITTGYKRVPLTQAPKEVPPFPASVTPAGMVVRDGSDYIRFGYIQPPRRLPQLWVQAFSLKQGSVSPNADGDEQKLDPTIRTILSERSRIFSRLRIADLESRTLLLSYVDADAALFSLRAMGYSAITDSESLQKDDSYKGEELLVAAPTGMPGAPGTPGAPGMPDPNQMQQQQMQQQQQQSAISGLPPDQQARFLPRFPAIKNLPTTISFDRLPIIVRVPSTEPRNLGLVGADLNPAQAQANQFGTSMVPSAAAPLTETVAGGTAELLILFHPDYPEQFQKLKRIVQDSIDRPARQVFIEGLVLEISKEGLDELGVQWDIRKGNKQVTIGSFGPVPDGGSAFSFMRSTIVEAAGGSSIVTSNISPAQIAARINALVTSSKAEVLSRPSVITLDNRQATIRVGTDIPVSKSRNTGTNTGQLSFDFSYLPTGIMLNVRPRISEDGQEISMLIDATVSATVPNQDLRVIDPVTRLVVASAPTVATRRVQTYARIRDNMPLIIGGLVSKSTSKTSGRVPLLGSIPIVGALFGHTSTSDDMREVIIVLTPSVVTENIRETKAQYPKDDARFDLFATSLFKEHYRIRAEDLVDSAHFRFNQRFLRYRDAANRVIERKSDLATQQPFAQFAGSRIPGEFIFVTGMMYRMLDRLDAGAEIRPQNLTFFEKVGEIDQRPVSVTQVLARYGDGADPKSFFAMNPGKALALTFRFSRASSAAADMFTEPLPEIKLVDAPDRAAWRRLLWDTNQRDALGARFTVLIQDPSDLRRLQLALATQNTVLNNGGNAGMVFDRWLPGRMLHLQEVTPTWERVVNAQIAQFFFIGEYYYPYFMQEHTRAIEALDRALRAPEIAPLLEGVQLPPA